MLETTVDMRIFEHFSSAWPDRWQTERIGRKRTALFIRAERFRSRALFL